MFHRIIEALRESTTPSGFESYMRTLNVRRANGGPTADEARRDFRSIMRRR